MTPVEFAGNLARSEKFSDQVLGVAIITRGLTDDDPVTHRQGWPLDWLTVERAAESLGLVPSFELVEAALARAPKVSLAMLNRTEVKAVVEVVEFCGCTNEQLEAGKTCGQITCPNG